MATESINIFKTKKEKLVCNTCGDPVPKGELFVAESETKKGTCFNCSPFRGYSFLKPGDAAMTRRSKKYSDKCGVVWEYHQRNKRYQRIGQYVQLRAIALARKECDEDAHIRAEKNKKAAVVRAEQDKEYILRFAYAIRKRYPNCPPKREVAIAIHACEKHSGRVGRTAQAKEFDPKMIDLAVEAHIRHQETNYDDRFGKGQKKREIRADIKQDIDRILASWR